MPNKKVERRIPISIAPTVLFRSITGTSAPGIRAAGIGAAAILSTTEE
jgi:hypothetical protein